MNAIELNNVCKSFDGFKLNNVSFNLPTGCILGLIGENGAGKSTTIKLILDVLNLQKGSINVFGKDHKQLDKNDVGVVNDDFGMPDCLNAFQLEDVMSNIFSNWNHDEFVRLCNLLNIPTDKKYKDLSMGNKMKIRIVVAMSHNASLLILDEPTNGLDPVVRDEVISILFDFTRNENHSILISSHIVSDLEKVCDYICFMHDGKVMIYEEKDELLNNYGVINYANDETLDINENAIIKIKQTSYSKEILIDRRLLTSDRHVSPINIEDLFVFMVKEGR